MDKITNSFKNVGLAIQETFKKNPERSVLKVAAVVAMVALAVLFGVLLGPFAPVPIVVGLTALMLANPLLIAYALFYHNISEALFNQFKKNHTIDKITNSDVVLILEAKHDHNGAFQSDQRDLFEKLEKKYAIAHSKVSNLDDIAESINNTLMGNNRIKAIWFRAHGNPTGMCLDKNSYLTTQNVDQLKHHFKQIDPDGYFIFESCSTGGGNPHDRMNIAQKTASLVKGRTAIAPCRDTNSTSLMLGKKNPLDVKMWIHHNPSKHPLLKYPSKVKNEIADIISYLSKRHKMFKNFSFDATQVYSY